MTSSVSTSTTTSTTTSTSTGGTASNTSSVGVRVIVRVRPLLPHEIPSTEAAQQAANIVQIVPSENKDKPANTILLRDPLALERSVSNKENDHPSSSSSSAANNTATSFTYDAVYPSTATQSSFFSAEVAPTLPALFQGQNVSIFAFGMSGTGMCLDSMRQSTQISCVHFGC